MTLSSIVDAPTTYEAFLSTKRIVAQPSGFDVAEADINPILFPHQRAIVQLACRKGRFAIFAAVGLGKTYMQCEVARLIGQCTLIIAPLAVAHQTVDEAVALDINVRYVRGMDEVVDDGIYITNYEMAHAFDASAFGTVILDECFAPNTPIDTPSGPVAIKDIRVGDTIFNAAGIDRVADVHRREVKYAVRITVNGKTITSSPNHPYFTQRGWIGAQDLIPGDRIIESSAAMRLVRHNIHPQALLEKTSAILREILLSEMADEATRYPSKSTCARSSEEAWRQTESLAGVGKSQGGSREGTYPCAQSNSQRGSTGEDLPPIERDEARTFRAWGQWPGVDGAATDLAGCTWHRMGSGISFVTGSTDAGLSHTLQARHRQSQAENRYRSGWQLTSQPESTGFEKGCEAGFAWVESLEVLEPGHPELEKLRDADGRIYLYDLGATQHPSFSINGLLVHNSSILKGLDGKIRQQLTEQFAETPYRFGCTATPAPNDITEMANHAEFLGIMTRVDMLAQFFTHDDKGWRLKRHAEQPFYRWLASWAVAINKPSDLGFSDDGYELPPCTVTPHFVETDYRGDGQLFFGGLKGVTDRARVRQASLAARCQFAADRINAHDEQVLVFVGLNEEGRMLHRLIPGSVLTEGSQKADVKIKALRDFQAGKVRVLITKSRIAGMGMNFQQCHRGMFVGLGDSWEAYYQNGGRIHRFGQKEPVQLDIVLSSAEQEVWQNVQRKETEARHMTDQLIAAMHDYEQEELHGGDVAWQYQTKIIEKPDYTLMLGDSAERLAEVADGSVGLSVFSPPFLSLYTYSPTERDLGNCRTPEEFYAQFAFIIDHLMRVTMPGRNCCVHVSQVPAMLVRDNYIGIKDFRGDTINAFEDRGWIYHGEVCIDKDPQAQSIRTHSKGLAFQQLHKDSSWLRPALADYILVFRKPGENPQPIVPDISNDDWIEWARPIWYGIRESQTLNKADGRESADERHIAPLQLGVIERCIRLWSNPNDLICSPFMGIGSEGHEAVRLGRQFVGCELKPSYFAAAAKNIARAAHQKVQPTLFDTLDESEAA